MRRSTDGWSLWCRAEGCMGMPDVSNTAQVYVFCCAHAEQVKQHLRSAGWTRDGASMDVQVGPSSRILIVNPKAATCSCSWQHVKHRCSSPLAVCSLHHNHAHSKQDRTCMHR